MPVVNCLICGKEIERPNWQLKKSKNSTCSRECLAKYQKQLFSRKVTLGCSYCGKKFKRSPSLVKKDNKHHFCSKDCESKYRRKRSRTNRLELVTIECNWCGQMLWEISKALNKSKYNFCCDKCLDNWLEDVRGVPSSSYKILVKCANCGKEIERWKYEQERSKYFFCNVGCKTSFLRGKYVANWQGGISYKPYPDDWTEELKDKIRNRDNRQCQMCFRYESELKRKLSVHHIDGDRRNCNEDNLISFCINCHMKITGEQQCETK